MHEKIIPRQEAETVSVGFYEQVSQTSAKNCLHAADAALKREDGTK